MPWGRVDDTFHSHPKVLEIPRSCRAEAVGVFWMAISWSNAHHTDGLIQAAVLEELCGTPEIAATLVRVKLWHRSGKANYRIHDFLHFNQSKAQTEELSRQRSEAGRIGAAKRWQRDGTLPSPGRQTDGTVLQGANGTAMANDAPVPSRPVPVENEAIQQPEAVGARPAAVEPLEVAQ